MLQIRPCCEHCGIELPAHSTDAMICSFECTFCSHCVSTILENVCPNCGGGFSPRPIRPRSRWKDDNYLGRYPASTAPVLKPLDAQAHRAFAAPIKVIAPADR